MSTLLSSGCTIAPRKLLLNFPYFFSFFYGWWYKNPLLGGNSVQRFSFLSLILVSSRWQGWDIHSIPTIFAIVFVLSYSSPSWNLIFYDILSIPIVFVLSSPSPSWNIIFVTIILGFFFLSQMSGLHHFSLWSSCFLSILYTMDISLFWTFLFNRKESVLFLINKYRYMDSRFPNLKEF